MKRFQQLLASLSLLFIATLCGCGEPLVGANCADGYQKIAGRCVLSDGSVPDADADGSNDGALGDGSVTDGGLIDGGDGGIDPDSGCDIGLINCNDVCIDPNDPNTCGCSPTTCTSPNPLCLNGSCTNSCAPLSDCSGVCIDTTIDPANCGSCGTVCSSGICQNSGCVPLTYGHVIVIGHDYRSDTNSIELNKIIGNAVYISGASPVRVLAYQTHTPAAALLGTDNAIDEHPDTVSRGWTKTVVSDANNVTAQLATHHVFMIYAQTNAINSQLQQLGSLWSNAMNSFVRTGGIIIVLEAPSATNSGTFQVLSTSTLFEATGRNSIPSEADRLVLVAGGDLLAAGNLSATFDSFAESTSFSQVNESRTTVVVRDQTVTGSAVITHRAISPTE